ncbi:uncharacterized protein LOC128556908 [Mercenaria mercenaria]|uniref:uncharacterized protein LOC128556908 n=1 Tax=Mercenaria mercenaria TaxID=6596 RepID=UPI00234EDB41|nr:uncharacterized protein LOC128556908 [Mercenaria mercenaria]
MATAAKASDSIHDFPCFPCSEDCKNTEALFQCDECQTFYCQRCLDFHSKFIKNHTILDVTATKTKQLHKRGPESTPPVSSTDVCEYHHGKVIEMYCELHDEVCCTVCIAVKHRSCTGVEYIPTIAKTLLRGKDTDTMKLNLNEVTRDLRVLKSKQSAFLTQLNQQRDKIVNEIQQFNEKLMKKIKEVERSSIAEVEKRCKAITDDMNHDIKRVDQMLNDAETQLGKFTHAGYGDNATLFINLKLAERHMSQRKDCRTELFGKPLERIDYTLNPSLEAYVKHVEAMGHLKVSRRTVTPFVNILVPNPYKAVASLKASIQSDLAAVGIRSKFIQPFQTNADVYTVVIISDMSDLSELRFERERHWKMILLKVEESRSWVDKFSSLMTVPTGDEILRFLNWANVAARTSIHFTYNSVWNKYIFNQSDKACAMKMVAETIDN